MRGKKGNMVLYKITNSNNKEKQGAREYVAEISNPQTDKQLAQRIKNAPAINFFRGLYDLLDHSWQGVKYGAKSRQYFMKMALSDNSIKYPYVPKGTKVFVPGTYPVSRGGLPTVSISSINTSGSAMMAKTTLAVPAGFDVDVDYTFGQLSQWLIDANPILKDGDELTFVAVYLVNGNYVPVHTYITLDTSATSSDGYNALLYVLASAGLLLDSDGGYLTFGIGSGDTDTSSVTPLSSVMVGAAVILSRKVEGKATTTVTWMRSNADLFVTDSILSTFMTNTAYQNAIASYKSSSDTSSDWLLNQTGNDASSVGTTVENVSILPSAIFSGLNSDGNEITVAHIVNEQRGINAYVASYDSGLNQVEFYTYNGSGFDLATARRGATGETVTALVTTMTENAAMRLLGLSTSGSSSAPSQVSLLNKVVSIPVSVTLSDSSTATLNLGFVFNRENSPDITAACFMPSTVNGSASLVLGVTPDPKQVVQLGVVSDGDVVSFAGGQSQMVPLSAVPDDQPHYANSIAIINAIDEFMEANASRLGYDSTSDSVTSIIATPMYVADLFSFSGSFTY